MSQINDKDDKRVMISLSSYCLKCRQTTVLQIREATLPVTVTTHGPLKRTATAYDKETGQIIYVDALWLYIAGLEFTPYTLHKHFSGEPWDLTIITYTMPRAGVWDEETYTEVSADALKAANIVNNFGHPDLTKLKHKYGERDYISVALPSNDPRLLKIHEMEEYVRSPMNLNRNSYEDVNGRGTRYADFNYTELELSPTKLNRTITIPCNALAGYTGRMCDKCHYGFTRSSGKCHRCPPFWVCAATLANGFAGGFVLMIGMVMMVVADAGSVSNEAALKKIVLNHMQILGMATSFDLNWGSNTKEFFNTIGAFSSVGDQLIQSGCILNSLDVGMEPFYFKQMLYIFFTSAFLIGAFSFWHILAKTCCKSPKQRRREKAIETIESRSLQRRVMVAKRARRKAEEAVEVKTKGSAFKLRVKKMIKDKAESQEDGILAQVRKAKQKDDEYLMREAGVKSLKDLHTNKDFIRTRGRILAKNFINTLKKYDFDLTKIFHQYDPGGTGKITFEQFVEIVFAMDMGWTKSDVNLVAQVFDGSDSDGIIELSSITKYGKSATDSIILTLLIVVEVMYPTVVKSCASLFSCTHEIMDGYSDSWLRADLHISCTSNEHYVFVGLFIMPTILAFVIGAPVVGTWMLGRAIEKRGWHDDVTNYRYAVLIGGYTHKQWYWAINVFGRKLAMSVVASVMVGFGTKVQYLMAIVVVLTALTLQVNTRPFSSKMLNFMESAGLVCLFLSMYFGILFFWDSFGPLVLGFVGDFIVAVNITFIAWLARCMAEMWLWEHEGSWASKRILKYEEKSLFWLIVILSIPMIVVCHIQGIVGGMCKNPKAKGDKKTAKTKKAKSASKTKMMSVSPRKLEDGGDEGSDKAIDKEVEAVSAEPIDDAAGGPTAVPVAPAMPSLSEKARKRSLKLSTPAKPAKLWKWDGTLVDSRGREVVKVDSAPKRRRAARKDRRVSKINKKNSRIKVQIAGKKSDEANPPESVVGVALGSKVNEMTTASSAPPVSSEFVTALVGVADSLAKWFTDKKINVITSLGDMLYDLGVEDAQDMDDLDKDDIEMLSSALKPEDVIRFKEALKNQMLADMPITAASTKVNDGTDDGVDDIFEVFDDPLSSEEIRAVRSDLASQVKDHSRLTIFLSKFDSDQNGTISKKEFKALVETVAAGEERILSRQGLDQLWEAAWNGQPHEPMDEINEAAFELWLFSRGNAAPQKIDDDDEASIADLFD
jgi:Ca2+-binding EF-hand superfamily protein